MKKGTLRDSAQLTRDVSSVGHWGNGDYEIALDDVSKIENIMPLIIQSYHDN